MDNNNVKIDSAAGQNDGERFVLTNYELQLLADFWSGVIAGNRRAIGSDGIAASETDLARDRIRMLLAVIPDATIRAFSRSKRRRKHSPEVDRSRGIPARISYADEIFGRGGELAPEYDPIFPELIALLEYWETECLRVRYWGFVMQRRGSTDMREEEYADIRCTRIAKMLPLAEVGDAIERALTAVSATQDPELWEFFLNGTEPERDEHGVIVTPVRARVNRGAADEPEHD